MKICADFISNSSSTSFVLVGKIFNASEFVKQLIEAKKLPNDVLKAYEAEELSDGEVIDVLYDNMPNGLDIQTSSCRDYDVDEVCLGLDPSKMKDNETLGEFKEKVLKKLARLGLEAKKSEVDFVTGGSHASGMTFFESCG